MKKGRSAEQIVGLLRQADVDLGKGANVPDVCRRLGISRQTYYRWRTKYGGMDPKMGKQLQELQKWPRLRGAGQKASLWENGYVESFNGRLRDELLDRELFLSLPEARVVLDQWRMDYNHRRPHGGLKWTTPAAFVAGLDDTASGMVPAAARGVSPVGAALLPPTHHADCSPTLS
jgi:transposase-like protein